MRRFTDWLVYLIVRLFICVVQALDIQTCHSLARGLAYVANDLVGLRCQVIDENLRHVYPQLPAAGRRRMARAMWTHLFLMVCEVAHVPRKVHATNWRRYIELRDLRQLAGYLLDPRPTVIVSGHFGNFEVAGYVTGLMGFPCYTIARPIDNPYLDRFVNRFRAAQGQFILPKEGSSRPVQQALAAGRTLTLLGDQHAGTKGCWVDFLGRPASCHKAVALFTLSSGAPLLVAYARRQGEPLRFEIGLSGLVDPQTADPELLDVRALTQWYNRRLEAIILRDPEQYWWVHRRWKKRPRRRSKAAPRSAEERSAA